jgi:hypothetical protein
MAVLLSLAILAAAVAALFILALRWAWAEDHKATLKERFDRVISGWGQEK